MKTIILDEERPNSGGHVATIGCFDGVHRGHQLLLRQVKAEASREHAPSLVVTFDRLPRELFDNSFRPQLLTTLAEKKALLHRMGIDMIAVLPFTRQLAGLTAKEFMQQILQEQLHVKTLITGYDNRFGHNRSEGFDDYKAYGGAMGMTVMRGEEVRFADSDRPVSSSAIRQLLTEGQVALAAEALTRPYQLTGRVVSGEHIGHRLGFPTANLQPEDSRKLIPAAGAYAVWAETGGKRLPAMMNIGTRPTFQGHHLTIEVHILGEVGDLYGAMLKVEFIDRLRAERQFESQEALIRQLEEDKQRVKELFASSSVHREI